MKPFKLLLTLALILVGQCAWGVDLTTNLVDVYEWNSNGDDLVGGHTLGNNGSAGFGAGKPATATILTIAGPRWWNVADNADESLGGAGDFTICAWVNFASLSQNQGIVSKYNYSSNQREYALVFETTDNFKFYASSDGTNGNTHSVAGSTFGAPSTSTWYWVVAEYRSGTNLISVSVNNGTADTASHAGGVFDGTSNFNVGTLNDAATYETDASIGQVLLYKRLLTAPEKTQLYNGGNGLAYASFLTPASNSNFFLFFSRLESHRKQFQFTNDYALAP